jgi:trk system potassium uptake protein TrkH
MHRIQSGSLRLALGFAALIAVGTVLLRFPAAARDASLTWLDALFTATSGVCVTGLSTIMVGERLSTFGQTVLLALIQLGGLGITTMSTLLLVAAGRATLSHHAEAEDQLAAVRVKPARLLLWVVMTTAVAETVGAAVLSERLDGDDAWWRAIFHSVSAFCNAGFSLFPDSLTRYRSDPAVLATIMTLIALGGLGFIALRQLSLWLGAVLRRRRAPLFLHTRVVLAGSLCLWGLGAAMFLVLEWNRTLAGLPVGTRVGAGLFQSVTTRTAGFNTLDFGAMRESTLFFTLFLMLIGGAPGSAAGGVKVTTAVVILAAIRARIRNVESVSLFRRTVPAEIVQRAFQLVALAILFLTLIVAGLLITEETLSSPHGPTHHFLSLAFEAVSAFGTVGLSTGLTPALSAGGKLLIITCMFVGRVGPLALALAVFRPRGHAAFEYPREDLAIG